MCTIGNNYLCVMIDVLMLFSCTQQLSSLMVIGIDSYHDSSARGKSAGGFVASVNKTLTRFVMVTPMFLSPFVLPHCYMLIV